ncbi:MULTISPECIES: MarR family winged helix-turn-helix transcriptional regulator [Cellulomonas]|jgi:DNA-binding MarR family transcriptional regulator|uniref:DNA-binding MarR family transcriptional regulator n=1 Tax=Cellulomonas iranensis TaxID=76862 RepID=A0ABU0GLX6_9CELL|nr:MULTISPECIES: MarR family transcriptional regulator [Cellulomonas]MDQ0426364.1 DNA-binding MarR family transcriptional regulator [Cellulomonas iranensis]TFH74036.1 MarR family transcriptional regulator [Cellulomonas sp. HD19AZ1]UCN15769.1 MarR family transcriptional regulator [Cellulomonas iranensis]
MPASRTSPTPDRLDLVGAAWRAERPDLDVRPQQVIGRLHRVANHLTAELVAVYERHGLSEGDFDVLATLRRAGAPYARSCGDIAAHTLVTSGGVTKRVDRLERAGLVTRRVADDDARARLVELTPRGREVIDAAFTDHMANEHRLLDALTPQDADTLERILRTWLAALEEPPATA